MRNTVVFLATLAVGCGSSSSSSSPVEDASTPKADTGAKSMHDAGKDGASKAKALKEAGVHDAVDQDAENLDADEDGGDGFDAGPPPVPVGTPLVKSGNVELLGLTDDGYVIYEDISTGALEAVPAAGGTASPIAALGTMITQVFIMHNDVFVWSNINQNNVSPLSIWSHSLGSAKVVSATSAPGIAAVSADSTAIVYAGSSDGSSATLYGVNTAALGTSAPLVANVDVTAACYPAISFSGVAPLYAVTGTCSPATSDGGADGPEVVSSFLTTTWKGGSLATGATSYWVDGKGTSVAIALGSQLEIVPLAPGGAPVLIDTATALSTPPSLYLSGSDAFVLYATSLGALKTSSLTGVPAPTTLVASGATDLDAISGTEAWSLIDDGQDMTTGFAIGVSLASTSMAATPTALTPGAGDASAGDAGGATGEIALMGDTFTANSSYAIFTANATTDELGYNIGTLMAVSTTNPAKPITIAKASGSTLGFFENTSSGPIFIPIGLLPPSLLLGGNLSNEATGSSLTDVALTDGKIVYVDSFNSSAGMLGQLDLDVIDLSTQTAGTPVMKSADPYYAVTADKKYIVYTITFGGSSDGIYSVAVP